MGLLLIDGKFHWQWSNQLEAYFAMYDFSIRPCYYSNLLELEQAIEKCTNNLISRYSNKAVI